MPDELARLQAGGEIQTNRESSWLLRLVSSSQTNREPVFPTFSALFVLLSGLLVLAGRLYFPDALRKELSFLAAMPERAALGFVLIGFMMRLARRENVNRWTYRKAKLFRVLVGAFSVFMVAEHFLIGVNSPEILAMPAALCFFLLGFALVLRKRLQLGQFLIFGAGLIALTALIACIYVALAGLQIPAAMRIDAPSAILLLVATVGMLQRNSHGGLMAVVTSDTIGGSQARLLLPASILIPILLGFVRLLCERAGLITNDAGLILHVVMTILLMAVVVWWNASTLVRTTVKQDSASDAIQEIETAYRNVLQHLTDAVYITDVQGNVRFMNPAAERLFGLNAAQVKSANIRRFLRTTGRGQDAVTLSELLGGPSTVSGVLLTRRPSIEVQVCTTVRFHEGNPVEVLAIVRPVGDEEPGQDLNPEPDTRAGVRT